MGDVVADAIGCIATGETVNNAGPTLDNNISSAISNEPENPLYNEYERLKTFPKPWSHRITKRAFAKNGFFYLLVEKKCQCVFCNLIIKVEEITGTQAIEYIHQQFRNCDFAFERDVSRNIPLGDVSDYRFEKYRLISFLSANWFAPVDPYDLAKFGFYWTGIADVGRCTFCRLEVRGWEPDDRGESEHMRWNPHCPFIQGRAVGNIKLGEEASVQANIAADCMAIHMPRMHDSIINPSGQNVEDLGVMLTAPPRHPDYATITSRMSSYSMWPLSMRQRPTELAEAGFYYTSKGDRVICFQCGGGLKDWGQTDLPWVEHAVWFPRCAYLLMKKGREFVSQVQILKNAQMGNHELQELTQSSISSHQPALVTPAVEVNTPEVNPPEPMEESTSNEPTALAPQENRAQESTANDSTLSSNAPENAEPKEETSQNVENETLSAAEDMRMCKVCYQKELGIVFLPCGHMATCPDCAPQLTSCPICRSKTNAYVRAFLP